MPKSTSTKKNTNPKEEHTHWRRVFPIEKEEFHKKRALLLEKRLSIKRDISTKKNISIEEENFHWRRLFPLKKKISSKEGYFQ